MSSVVSTAKAAAWLGVPERTVRDLCAKGKLEGAYQPAGYQGAWLIPITTLEAIRSRPVDMALFADLAKIANM
jgi:hypothetical protein